MRRSPVHCAEHSRRPPQHLHVLQNISYLFFFTITSPCSHSTACSSRRSCVSQIQHCAPSYGCTAYACALRRLQQPSGGNTSVAGPNRYAPPLPEFMHPAAHRDRNRSPLPPDGAATSCSQPGPTHASSEGELHFAAGRDRHIFLLNGAHTSCRQSGSPARHRPPASTEKTAKAIFPHSRTLRPIGEIYLLQIYSIS